jgi:DNA polymerase-3 subunit delta
MAMFGGGQRVVVVDGADDFVSRYRGELEDEATHGRSSGVLILQVKSLPANTRLYKSVAANGLLIDANTPSGVKLPGWLSGWARSRHQAKLPKAAATLLVETAGEELGLLDQEIAKLALMAGPGGEITTEMVRQHVGGWRTRTTWDMLDAALDGNLPEALKQLDRLLGSGEQPIALLGQIGFSLRRLAATTRLVIQSERRGRRTPLRRALEEAGTRPFLIKKLEGQLRRLGRARGQRLYEWLLQADLDLKGASPAPPRVVLERLIVRLAAPADVVGA